MFTGHLLSGDDIVAEIKNGEVIPRIKSKMPLYLAHGGSFEKWLESRAIDRHRPNSRILKKVLRLTDTSDVATVLHANAATITDDFWIRQEGCTLSYAAVQFKEDIFADIALSGDAGSFSKCYNQAELSSKTPELTNIGSFEKCWRLEANGWVMYKRGNPLELFSELFVSELAMRLGFNTARYERSGDFIKTKDFTEGRYNFEPMSGLVGEDEGYLRSYDTLMEISPKLAEQYLDILFMDTICMNMDRHTGNYGLLREKLTGEIISMAPNFDNNISLISRGYLSQGASRSNLLTQLFSELISERKVTYYAPEISKEELREIAVGCDVCREIDIDYVVDFVAYYLEAVQAMLHDMRHEQDFGLEMGF